ncbi:hypothetical protein EXIGLDRAFT_642252 [Exidia glandulosa HHB12029]|uniref:Uncharacterized protein n=1 Tax=Exidia glandulosa HHB12029 TaxID=1314781 RepID=A0A165L7W8_EXIGL|nr:hypothetical protein EXIGLDRAFT_642252 [Exidia glandulosa HHB12029]
MPVMITPEARPPIFRDTKTSFAVTQLQAKDISEQSLAKFLDGRNSDILGCSATYVEQTLQTLTLATSARVLHIHMHPRMPKLSLLEEMVLQNPDLTVLGCNLDRVAFGLFLDAEGTRVTNFVDLHSLRGRGERSALKTYHILLGGEPSLHVEIVNAVFGEVPEDE